MIGTLPEFRLETWFSRWEFTAQHSFTASDAETMRIGELLELAGVNTEELAALDLGYRPTFGTPDLREAIAATYETLDGSDVIAFGGAQEALLVVLSELLAGGGHAIVTVPNYQSFETVPLAGPAAVTGWPLWEGSGPGLRWTMDLDRLRTLLRPDTRVVAVNVPNNPSGFVPDGDTFVELAALCDERGIVLVSDEVYRGIETDPSRTLPQAADLAPGAVSINVMSKSYGLPGLRIGWAATRDRALLDRLERRKHYTSICNPGVTEFLAAAALRVGPQIHARNRALVAENVGLVRAFFGGHPDRFAFEAPDGGCVSFPRYLGADGAETFALRAVEEGGVLTLPGSIYRSALADVPTDRIRIGFGRSGMPAVLAALEEHLERAYA